MGGVFSSTSSQAARLHFISLGLVVLDELHFPDRETLYDIPGGSGAFATLGARMTVGAACSNSVACILLTGDDFPAAVLQELQTWKMHLVVRKVANAKSTRGLLEYLDADFGRKTFRYLTPPLQAKPEHLEASGLLHAPAFHILAKPDELEALVADLLSRRARNKLSTKPLLVWEPAPPHCIAANRDAHLDACRLVDVFSPNHLELASLLDQQGQAEPRLDRAEVERYAQRFRDARSARPERSPDLVVRAGELGCLIILEADETCWLPPFHDPSSPKMVDPTGAGNAFLGAMTMKLQQGCSLKDAAIHGSVTASFAVEQIGLPALGSLRGAETWNGTEFSTRLDEYRRRVD